MAFLSHPPRRSARSQLSTSASTASQSHIDHSPRRGESSAPFSERNGQDWSVVFPGRSATELATTSKVPSESLSPFVSSPDEREASESNVELTLPLEQDGTGRFTRPSSPSYAADDENEDDEVDQTLRDHHSKLVVPSIKEPSLRDSGSSNSDLDNDSDLDALEITSSILISGSETDRKNSSVSQRRRRLSEWENGAGTSSLSSSWAWMNVEGSNYSRGKERAGRNTEILPVVFTSGSEGEEEGGETLDVKTARLQRKKEEDEAFEEALGNAPTAQSAGLMARAPKRRHRKNGESAKGSKRSNSSAIPASDMRLSRRSAALRSRRPVTSNLSASIRSSSRVRYMEQAKETASNSQDLPESQGILKAILRKIFQVQDDEVLQAFLRDEGPLRVDDLSSTSAVVDSASALAMMSAQHTDDIWTRNERKRYLQASHAVVEEGEETVHEEQVQMMRIPRSTSSSELFAAPHRIKLQSNVGEPTLLEALQASVLSSSATVPSGFSILLAGSRSARLVNYLAGRFVGQIGPSLTERVRKLIDDAEDDTTIQDDILGSETRSSSTSSTRFRGNSHPAISSRSSSTVASKGPL